MPENIPFPMLEIIEGASFGKGYYAGCLEVSDADNPLVRVTKRKDIRIALDQIFDVVINRSQNSVVG